MKICTKCLVSQQPNEFGAASNGRDGLRYECNQCRKFYRVANKDQIALDSAAYYAANTGKIKAASAARRVLHPDKIRASSIAYCAANAETIKVRRDARNAANPERKKAIAARSAKVNAGSVNARHAKRRARKIQATPVWANMDAIKFFYVVAARCTKATGESYHVDHVIPLQGKSVCGLHIHSNLQILTALDNMRKGVNSWFRGKADGQSRKFSPA